jgi:hypothetical protein
VARRSQTNDFGSLIRSLKKAGPSHEREQEDQECVWVGWPHQECQLDHSPETNVTSYFGEEGQRRVASSASISWRLRTSISPITSPSSATPTYARLNVSTICVHFLGRVKDDYLYLLVECSVTRQIWAAAAAVVYLPALREPPLMPNIVCPAVAARSPPHPPFPHHCLHSDPLPLPGARGSAMRGCSGRSGLAASPRLFERIRGHLKWPRYALRGQAQAGEIRL